MFLIVGCSVNNSANNNEIKKTPGVENSQNNNSTQVPDLENSSNNKAQTPDLESSSNYDKELQTNDTLFPVKNLNDKWGYIDKRGNLKIDYIYESADFFSDGKASVCKDGKYGYIFSDGKYFIEPQYDLCCSFSDGAGRVVVNDGMNSFKHGFVNENGEVFLNEIYNNNTGDFHEGLAYFEKDGKFGYVDKKGNIVIKPQFQFAFDFSEGLAMVINDEYKCGFINKEGKVVIDFKYDPLDINFVEKGGFREGLARVRENNEYKFINSNGETVIDALFERALDFSEDLAPVRKDGKWGYINKRGEMIITPQFAYCTEFNNGYAFAKSYDNNTDESMGYGVINKRGEFTSSKNIIYDIPGGGWI